MGAETTSVFLATFPFGTCKGSQNSKSRNLPQDCETNPEAAGALTNTHIQTRATLPTKFHKVLGKTRHLPEIKIKVQPFQYRTVAGFCLQSRVFPRHSRGDRSPHPREHYGVAGHHRDTLCVTCAYLTAWVVHRVLLQLGNCTAEWGGRRGSCAGSSGIVGFFVGFSVRILLQFVISQGSLDGVFSQHCKAKKTKKKRDFKDNSRAFRTKDEVRTKAGSSEQTAETDLRSRIWMEFLKYWIPIMLTSCNTASDNNVIQNLIVY